MSTTILNKCESCRHWKALGYAHVLGKCDFLDKPVHYEHKCSKYARVDLPFINKDAAKAVLGAA